MEDTGPTAAPEAAALVVRGARTHNLKNIDLTLPSGSLIIVTGVSGSGKSSLAFDTIYAEGQRRYVESLSAYARQFLERMEKPDVERIDGISPAIAIRQKNSVRNPRSTVGTTTEIHDYMRLLYARIGRTFCRKCGREVIRETPEVVARQLSELPPGTRLLIGFDLPVVDAPASARTVSESAEDAAMDESGEAGDVGELFGERHADAAEASSHQAAPESPSGFLHGGILQVVETLRRRGFGRLLLDLSSDRTVEFDDLDPSALRDRSMLHVVVDRLQLTGPGEQRQRLTDSVETAYLEGGGAAWAIETGHGLEPVTHHFSERFECRQCRIPYEVPQPRLFSFNNPFGACPTCHGFGNIIELDMGLVVPDPRKSIQQGAIEPWSRPHYRGELARLKRAARARGIRFDVPWADLTEDERRFIVDGEVSVPVQRSSGARGLGAASVGPADHASSRNQLGTQRSHTGSALEPEPDDPLERDDLLEPDDPLGRGHEIGREQQSDRHSNWQMNRESARDLMPGSAIDEAPPAHERGPDGWGDGGEEERAKSQRAREGGDRARQEREESREERDGPRKDARYGGIRGFFRWLERKKYKVHVRVFLSRYRGYLTCPDCGGARLRREARDVRIAGRTIDEVSSLTVQKAQDFFANLALTEKEAAIAEKVLKEIRRRLAFLSDVGLEYLTLDRLSSTLSGGESQRINLATSLGSSLVGTLYVLDEPSIGLHPRDNQRLITILLQLRDQGNTVLVVEHDADMMRMADHVVDLGLGAGEQGGRVVFSGRLDGLLREPRSLTSKYLRHELAIPVPAMRRRGTGQKIRILGASEHNLKDIEVSIPLNTLTCVTGVSGSGKSTLVHDVLYAAIKRARGDWDRRVGTLRKLEGAEFINDAVLVDQAPIGRTPRSNPVTYLKAFDPIRELFAATKDARARGLTQSHFSFNVPGGRCEACQGEGEVRVEMQFLADVFVPCDHCDGKRFKPQVLEVRYRGRTIHEVLELTVREALSFFSSSPKVLRRLHVLDEIGLGYLRLGQPATTLSGGEAQRIKIAAHLSSHGGERLLYILDEPTTGLHFDDIAKLLASFRKLLDAGHTLLVIEHNLDVIKTADMVIDLGPEGGEQGGRVVAAGTPEQVAQSEVSYTGRCLRTVLAEGRSHAYAAGR